MNKDEIYGVLRAFVASIGGIGVAKGYIDNETLTAFTGAFATIFTAVWSVLAKRKPKA